MVLAGTVEPGDKVKIDVEGDDLHFELESGAAEISESEAEAAAEREEQPATI